MLIFAIDENERVLKDMEKKLKEAIPEAGIHSFLRPEDALFALQKRVSPKNRLEVRCFGYFDVMWQGQPLIFARKQSKELLAYLIDREGAACSSGEIALALWEDEVDEKSEKNRIRVLINDLKNTLKGIGMEDVLIRDRREIAVNRELLDCDYYRLLKGDMTTLDSYMGEYMKQYGWAELTNGRLHLIAQDNDEYRNSYVLYM